MSWTRFRRRVHELLRGSHREDRLSRWVNHVIIALIVATVLAFMLETVPSIQERFGVWLFRFEMLAVFAFTVEYVGRVWSAVEEPRFAHPLKGRLRWMVTPLGVVDLLAILPFFLATVLPHGLIVLRLLRLFRVVRLAKIARYSRSLQMMVRVVRRKRRELVMAFFSVGILLVLAAWGMWMIEHPVQPDAFPSVPETLWWAVITITTVGYGDVVPITMGGRLLAGVVALLGVGFIALPAGLLAAGFVEELEGLPAGSPHVEGARVTCPRCGETLGEGGNAEEGAS